MQLGDALRASLGKSATLVTLDVDRMEALLSTFFATHWQPVLDSAQADLDRLSARNAELERLNGAQAERIAELQRRPEPRT